MHQDKKKKTFNRVIFSLRALLIIINNHVIVNGLIYHKQIFHLFNKDIELAVIIYNYLIF